MRIVAGRHRGRVLRTVPGRALRPTLDRVREAAFNVLAHGLGRTAAGWQGLEGARVVDAFAGSGACGLEALSRGAAHAVFIDDDAATLAGIGRNAAALGEEARITLLRADASRPGPRPPAIAEGCTLAFVDPPYGRGLALPALAALAAGGWLAPGAIAAVETGAGETLAAAAPFVLLDQRRWGPARVWFLRHA